MKLALKFLTTALLLWLVFRTVDLEAVGTLLSRLSVAWLLLALVLTLLIIVCDAMLFAGVMRVLAGRIPLRVSMLYSLVGWFFSNLAPSTVGGDVFRGAQLAQVGMPVKNAVRLILAMRILSLAALVLVMAAGLPIALGLVRTSADAALLGFTLAAAGGAVAAVFALAHVPAGWRARLRIPLLRHLAAVADDVRKLAVPGASTAATWTWALAQHLVRIGVLAALAAGLGLAISFATILAFVPAALLVAMVPVSIGGWGVREVAFVTFLGVAGVSAEAAIALSIAFGFLRIVVGVVGGLTWVVVGKNQYRFDLASA